MGEIMKFVVNRFGPKVLFPWDYIGSGLEAKVYKKKDMAYKRYRLFSECSRLSLDDVSYLKNIPTRRILLPQETLYNIFGHFKGYTTKYIENLGLVHYMHLPTECIFNDFSILKDDCRILGEKHIRVADLIPKDREIYNHSFHNGLYFVDPGRFYQVANEDIAFIEDKNKEMIDNFIYYRIFSVFADEVIGRYRYDFSKLYSFRKIIDDNPGQFMDFLMADIQEDTLGEYVKKKVK